MPSISENVSYYDSYQWSRSGEEWSDPWGGTWPMWKTSIYPRISAFLPAEHIVEIGCGKGRISKLLTHHAVKLSLTDINSVSVDHCSDLFAKTKDVSATLTDGLSLSTISNASVDFAISFYSLVAADEFIIRSYLSELSRVLQQDGVAFIHHSNAGLYSSSTELSDDSLQLLSRYRDMSVSAYRVSEIAAEFGLVCVRQECINWDVVELLTDCFSTIVKSDSTWVDNEGRVTPLILENYNFSQERNWAKKRYYRTPRRPEKRAFSQ